MFHPLEILPVESNYDQFLKIKELIYSSSIVYNAFEPTPDGEVAFRDLYNYIQADVPVKRMWMRSLEKTDLSNSFEESKPQEYFDKLARQSHFKRIVDWTIGINASAAVRLKLSKMNLNYYVAVGRFQTPILKKIAERQQEIYKFVPSVHFDVSIPFKVSCLFFFFNFEFRNLIFHQKAKKLNLKLKSEEREREKLEKIASSLKKESKIISIETKKKTIEAPSLYSLSRLLVDGCEILSLPFSTVLSSAKHLYDAKLITFPAVSVKKLPYKMLERFSETLRSFFHFNFTF